MYGDLASIARLRFDRLGAGESERDWSENARERSEPLMAARSVCRARERGGGTIS